MGFPGGSVVKNLPANAGDVGLIPGLGRSPVKGNGKLLQYSCLGNPMDRGAWQATVHGVTKNQTWISNWTTTNYLGHCKVKWSESQSCLILCHPMDSTVYGTPGQNTGVGSYSLLQGIFPLNPGFLHCRWILYQLTYQGLKYLLCVKLLEKCLAYKKH